MRIKNYNEVDLRVSTLIYLIDDVDEYDVRIHMNKCFSGDEEEVYEDNGIKFFSIFEYYYDELNEEQINYVNKYPIYKFEIYGFLVEIYIDDLPF